MSDEVGTLSQMFLSCIQLRLRFQQDRAVIELAAMHLQTAKFALPKPKPAKAAPTESKSQTCHHLVLTFRKHGPVDSALVAWSGPSGCETELDTSMGAKDKSPHSDCLKLIAKSIAAMTVLLTLMESPRSETMTRVIVLN